jgi:hypothetical protein
MPQYVRTWALIVVAAAVTGAPALRTGAAARPHQRERISKRTTSHRKLRLRTAARLAPSVTRQERAIVDPPRPAQNSPDPVGHFVAGTRADEARVPRDERLELPRPPLRC